MPTTGSRDLTHKYDLFISYRREGGDATALFLREKLMQSGLRVFLDIIDLHKGYFDEALLGCIADSRNFLVILSPGALDRCVHPGDWLRQEIAHAIKTRRNIIPVLTRGFTFPAELPEDIATLPRHQGVEYSHMYHAAMVNSILMSVEAERAESGTQGGITPGLDTPVPFLPAPSTAKSAAPFRPSETQGRVLDAAMAAQIPIGKPAELMAMIRLSTSGGLKGVLKIEESDALPEDVRSRPFELEFPVDMDGKPQAAEVTLQVNAPDFDPPLQRKVLRVPAKADSPTYSFLLTPRLEGELRINLELCRGDVCLVSRVLRTSGTSSDIASSAKVLVSLPIEVKTFSSAPASVPMPGAAAERSTTPPRASAPVEVGSSGGGYFPESSPSPARWQTPGSAFPTASATHSPAPGGSSSIGSSGGRASAAPLAELFGMERGQFQQNRALAFIFAWLAASIVMRLLGQSLANLGFGNWFIWFIATTIESLVILGALWTFSNIWIAGLAAGLGATFVWLLANTVEYAARGAFDWGPAWRIAELLELAIFIWILGWMARKTNRLWQSILLGSSLAFFVGHFPIIVVSQSLSGWSLPWFTEFQPHIRLPAAVAFTAVFVLMTRKPKARA